MATADDLPEIHQRLVETFGAHTWEADLDPLSELVSTVLSQHTSGANSRRAFEQLRARFPTWEAALQAEVEAIAEAIKCAGLARQKAPRLKRLLAQIAAERGSFDLRFLAHLPAGEAMAWLRRLSGVGQTTAACALLFGLGRPVMPVDTGIQRIVARLGLAAPTATADEAQAALEAAIPGEWIYTLHVNLIRFGRQVCTASQPRCEICPLNDLCDYFLATHTRLGGGLPRHPRSWMGRTV